MITLGKLIELAEAAGMTMDTDIEEINLFAPILEDEAEVRVEINNGVASIFQ